MKRGCIWRLAISSCKTQGWPDTIMWHEQEANKTANGALRDMVSNNFCTYTACRFSLRENPLQISNESNIFINKMFSFTFIFLPYNKFENKTN
jgi:hypothetical protein